jgi:hypothetical protein
MDPANTWRTLSGAENTGEYTYLLNIRSSVTVNSVTNARYARCKLNNSHGLLIFPDEWVSGNEPSASLLAATVNANYINAAYPPYHDEAISVISTADFALLEAAGCVFLPAAGHGSTEFVDWGDYDKNEYAWGDYWSSTIANYSWDTEFNSGYYLNAWGLGLYLRAETHVTGGGGSGNNGCSVRLVQNN